MLPTLTPAYGRDYTSKTKVLQDFNDGKDFIYNNIMSRYDGKPCNKQDLISANEKTVKIRYAKLTKVIIEKIS